MMNQQKKPHLHLLNGYRRFKKLLEKGTVFCAFDTETTGLNPVHERIIEIGAVKFNKEGIISTYSQLINPKKILPPICMELSHISQDMVDDKPVFFDVHKDFLNFIGDSILVAHNAQFDLRFMNEELSRLNKSPLKNQTIDTLRFSRTVFPKPETTSWKLGALAQKFNIEVRESHRAMDDARVCMEVFLKCVQNYEISSKKKTTILEEPLQDQ